ncbi:MAG: response regulator [Ferruginibacter sp.]
MKQTDKLNILVIEDNEGDWFLINEYLQSLFINNTIDHSITLNEALSSISAKKYDVIFLDLSLPDSTDTKTTVNQILGSSDNAAIIVLTGNADSAFAKESLQSGIEDYLLKDEISASTLLKSIEYSIQRNKGKQDLIKLNKEREFEISDAVVKAMDKGKLEISCELHDNITQLLTGASIFLQIAMQKEATENDLLSSADNILRKAINEIRALSHTLAPPDFDGISLEDVLTQLINDTNKTATFCIEKDWDSTNIYHLQGNMALNIYRIIQEQLNNINKHAKAKNVHIKLRSVDNQVNLLIKDDGIGFNTKQKRNGIGLTNIKTRASLFNGFVDIISSPLKGCSLNVHLNI